MGEIPQGSGDQRALGERPAGYVSLRNFDEGVVITLGAEVRDGKDYHIPIDKVSPVAAPPGQAGVPITFAFPDDKYEHWRLPCIVVRRDDIAPAMNRWHPGMTTWRGPARGALPVIATLGTGPDAPTVAGYNKYEIQQQAAPFDITYTISIMARHRGQGDRKPIGEDVTGNANPKTQANQLLDYVMRIYQPYCAVFVRDSLGDFRTYEAFMEAVSHLDQVAEVTDRVIGFALTLRVEAELDLNDPIVRSAVTAPLTIRE
jgi:hypothetical protein